MSRVPQECPRFVVDIITACMRENPARRPTSKQVHQALQADDYGDMGIRSPQERPVMPGSQIDSFPARSVPANAWTDHTAAYTSTEEEDAYVSAASNLAEMPMQGGSLQALDSSAGDPDVNHRSRKMALDRSLSARGTSSTGGSKSLLWSRSPAPVLPMTSLPIMSRSSTNMHAAAEPREHERTVFSMQGPNPFAA